MLDIRGGDLVGYRVIFETPSIVRMGDVVYIMRCCCGGYEYEYGGWLVGWLVGVARKVLLSRGTADRVVSRAIFAPRCPEQGNRKAPETSQDSHYFEARGV